LPSFFISRLEHKDVQGFIRIIKKNEAYTAYLTFDDGSESKIERLNKKHDLYHLSYSRFNEFYRINHEGDLNVHYRNEFVTKCKVVE